MKLLPYYCVTKICTDIEKETRDLHIIKKYHYQNHNHKTHKNIMFNIIKLNTIICLKFKFSLSLNFKFIFLIIYVNFKRNQNFNFLILHILSISII